MTLVSGLRAAAQGIPFQPVAGVIGSDLMKTNDWKTIRDPYSGQEVCIIPAIQPDFAVIHATEVDEEGNVRVDGTPFWDRIMSRAAKRVLITAERIVSKEAFVQYPEKTLIPGFMVEAISIVPKGAWPGSCASHYDLDESTIEKYLRSRQDPKALKEHLEEAPEASGGMVTEDA